MRSKQWISRLTLRLLEMERDQAIFQMSGKPNLRKILLAVGFYGIPIAIGLAAYLIFAKRGKVKGKSKRPKQVSSKRLKTGSLHFYNLAIMMCSNIQSYTVLD